MRFTSKKVHVLALAVGGRHLFYTSVPGDSYGTRYVLASGHRVELGGEGARRMTAYLYGYGQAKGIEASDLPEESRALVYTARHELGDVVFRSYRETGMNQYFDELNEKGTES